MTPRNRRGTGRAPAEPFVKRVQQELIRQRRSQKSVLEAADVTPSTYYLLAKSPHRDLATRVNTVLRIAQVLGIDEEEALQLAGLPSTPPAGDEPATTPEEWIDGRARSTRACSTTSRRALSSRWSGRSCG